MDITAHDLNLQMQQLLSDYKRTGNEHYKVDAEYLRSEFEEWWNDEISEFDPPTTWIVMNFIELTDQQVVDLIYCIEGHIITCEKYNQGDEFDINTVPFDKLREDILNQVMVHNGN